MSGYGFRIPIAAIPSRRVASLRAVNRAIRAGLIEDLSDNAPPMFEDWIHQRFITVGEDTPDNDDDEDGGDEDEGEDDDDAEHFEADDAPRDQQLHFRLDMVGYWPDELGDHLLKLAASNFVRIDARLHVLGYRRAVPDRVADEPLLPTWREAYFGGGRSRFATPLFLKLGDEDDDAPTNAHAIMTETGLAAYCTADGEAVHPQTPIALETLSPTERVRFDKYIARGYCACSWCLSHGLFSPWNARGIASAQGWDVRPVDELGQLLVLDDNVQLYWAVSRSSRRHLRDGIASRFYRSRNGGLDWELLEQAGHERVYVLRVAKVLRGNRWVVYAAASDEPRGAEDRWLCSLDGGVTYRDETGPGTSCVFDSLQFFSCATRREQIAIATIDQGGHPRLHVSGDGGVTWKSSDMLAYAGTPITGVTRVSCSPADPGSIYAVCDAHLSGPADSVLLRSHDGGGRWDLVETLPVGHLSGVLVGREPGVIGVFHHDRSAMETRLLRSSDDGRTWSPALSLEDIDDTGTACSSGRGRWFCSTRDAGTYASDDEGATWSLVCDQLHGAFADDDPDDSQSAYLVSSGVLLRVRKLDSVLRAARRSR